MKDLMLKFSCTITGDDYQLMKTDTPASKKKVKTLVSTMFLPVIMWVINILLLVSGIMQGTKTNAIIAALVAGTIIFIVERSIIMSNGSKLVMAVRITLGFFIAILGSLAFDEVIFKTDIDQQLVVEKASRLKVNEESIDTYYSKGIKSQEDLVEVKRQLWTKSLDEARREADGSGGSGIKGVHAITKIKMDIAKQKEQDYHKSKAEVGSLVQKRDNEKGTSGQKIETSFNDHALLLRIKAMFDLIHDSGWMCFVYLIFTAILFVIEFIVVILKLSLPKSNYELKLEVIEEIGRKRMMKLVDSDINQFEYGQFYSSCKKAKDDISKLSSISFFN